MPSRMHVPFFPEGFGFGPIPIVPWVLCPRAMSVRRYRLANQPFRRRVPEVLGYTSDDVVSTFHEASWLAGPIGLLRARVAQRGLALLFDVPRAGAIVKHHLTIFNDPRCLWRLPDEVCGLCLARYRDDLKNHERCLWCSDSTICRACHISIHISRDDGRVQACFDPSVWGSEDVRLKMKYPFPASPKGDGYIVVQGCLLCVREQSLMPEAQALSRWPMGFRRMVREMITDDFKGFMAGYFYREFPRYYADHHVTLPGMHGHSVRLAGVCELCHEVTRDRDGAVNPNRVHACTSLQVAAYRQIFRAWAAAKRVPSPASDWVRLVYKVSLVHTASLAHLTVPGILAQAATDTESDSDKSMWGELRQVAARNGRLYPYVKTRVVFRGNHVVPTSPHRVRSRGAVLVPTRACSQVARDPWAYIENCRALPARAQPRFRSKLRRNPALE